MTLFIILYVVGIIVAYPLLKIGALAVELTKIWTLRSRIGAIAAATCLSWFAAFVGLVLWYAGTDKLNKKVKW